MTVDVFVSPPPRREVTANLTAMLQTVTTRPFGITDVPPPDSGKIAPTTPYGIVYPMNDGGYEGGLGAPESMGRFAFQVTSVGSRADQCEWLEDRVRNAILARTTAGSFVNALSLSAPFVVTTRWSLSGPGNMIRADQLWSVSETFMLVIIS